ncbi:sugar phosphate isomerase/epimerase [Mycolicibacterium flavescens]|uniref:Xylose isomerase n=1 Tax=Mycolicibacterium flavescens TaxID=1776 RepID=A0A1E3RJ18_MYCFV|nr:TIM barrel protein [Mycolicibacterium flavescens]MCV7283371.1 sugar phosphate isomerase/epimerase [Mycolicibacterium flavescens]ODQ89861.1 xylose isomerase [Mycolicibacterium flavescens]
MTDERLSVHSVTFLGEPVRDQREHWRALGVRRLSLIDAQLSDDALRESVSGGECSVESVYHLFDTPDALLRVIDDAAGLGARVVYMLTGGRANLTWEHAAERFCEAVAPCVRAAESAGVALAIENASALYADIHIAHSLRDTITLAEMAGLGVCIDLFHCWAEADLPARTRRALPRTELIQLSDYVLGDRALPARAVPGDGAIPIEAFVASVLAEGYRHGFDLELIGPRIDEEGRFEAARRACAVVSAMLDDS